MLQLETGRLMLREFRDDDWIEVHDYCSRAEACRYFSWGPNSAAQTRAFVRGAITTSAENPRQQYLLAMVLRREARVVGTAGLHVGSARFGQAEVSYVVHPDRWGQGLATEAARALLRFGFGVLKLHRVAATCDPRNHASERVLQHLGMHREGRLREVMLIRDGWRDSLIYGLLEREWRDEAATMYA